MVAGACQHNPPRSHPIAPPHRTTGTSMLDPALRSASCASTIIASMIMPPSRLSGPLLVRTHARTYSLFSPRPRCWPTLLTMAFVLAARARPDSLGLCCCCPALSLTQASCAAWSPISSVSQISSPPPVPLVCCRHPRLPPRPGCERLRAWLSVCSTPPPPPPPLLVCVC